MDKGHHIDVSSAKGVDGDDEKKTAHGRINYPKSRISITFDMNKLQHIPLPRETGSPGRVLVTMNPPREPRALQSSQVYYHPLLNAKSLQMTERLHELKSDGGVSFAGAWMGFGFHEDGFVAGTHAADVLIKGRDQAGELKLVPNPTSSMRAKRGLWVTMLRMAVQLVQVMINSV